ncbi:MAG: hypothetical protein HYZ83_02885 [Candidatus Omnitrophica bacterium]|nr:hypothetical protein [Candidatus Omnitrophota bacterium]
MNHFLHLLRLKARISKNSFFRLLRHSPFEFFILLLFFIGGSLGLFFFFHYSFRFFHSQEPFGPILMDETFYLFTFALFMMLFISSAVSSYTALFRSREVSFLAVHPIEWAEIYFLKLTEALWYSSWSFLFIVIPFMTAYGIAKQAEIIFFPVLCLVFFVPLILLSGIFGTMITVLLIWLLPDRKRRQIALWIGLILLVAFFAKASPSVLKEQGSLAGVMSGYLPHVAFAKNGLLPSSWATRGILALSQIETQEILRFQEGIFYFLLLLSNTLFFLIPSYSVAKHLYPRIFFRSQDHSEMASPRRVKIRKGLERWVDHLPYPRQDVMAFLEKDLKTFARDPAEWSQLIIFFGLLLLYFANLKNLEFHVLKSFWKNLVFVLNTVGTYIVLSSFNMRFVFPMLSHEGSRFWIIDLSPVRFSTLLLEKFLLGTFFSVILTMPLVFLSGWMLEIPPARVAYTTAIGFFVCVALTGLSVGLGARFPNFKSTNPSEIISGFGGSLLMATHLLYLAGVGLFLMFSKESHALIFITFAAASLLAGTLPIKIGLNALKKMEF